MLVLFYIFFFFQAEDGIRDYKVTGVQTCALTICRRITTAGWWSTSAPTITDSKRVASRSEEHTSELQSPCNLVCRLLLEKKKKKRYNTDHRVWNYQRTLTYKQDAE